MVAVRTAAAALLVALTPAATTAAPAQSVSSLLKTAEPRSCPNPGIANIYATRHHGVRLIELQPQTVSQQRNKEGGRLPLVGRSMNN
jgi:hypothetical protein